jgi:hypothetical protein
MFLTPAWVILKFRIRGFCVSRESLDFFRTRIVHVVIVSQLTRKKMSTCTTSTGRSLIRMQKRRMLTSESEAADEPVIERSVLERSIDDYFSTIPIKEPGVGPHIYKIHEEFHNPYWQSDLPHQFNDTLENGLLYRPIITEEIIKAVESRLKLRNSGGVMVTGPHGIGKSHSLVNAVRKLQSSNNYLVTFIPNCEKWRTTQHLVNTICASFGTKFDSIESLFFPRGRNIGVDFPEVVLPTFISAIDSILKEKNKKWVFVFDQINSLFARYPTIKEDVGLLPFPFYMITQVMMGERITSIISASVGSKAANKGHRQSFSEYFHKVSMSDKEIQTLYNVSNDKLAAIGEMTGNVPFYVDDFIKDEDHFIARHRSSINVSIGELLESTQGYEKEALKQTMILFLRKMELQYVPYTFDGNYYYKEDGKCLIYKALFPLVEAEWREQLWKELSEFNEVNTWY